MGRSVLLTLIRAVVVFEKGTDDNMLFKNGVEVLVSVSVAEVVLCSGVLVAFDVDVVFKNGLKVPVSFSEAEVVFKN